MEHHTIDKLVTESLVNRLAEGELDRANLEARYTLTLVELRGFKAVLEYEPALKELVEETLAKMKGTNA